MHEQTDRNGNKMPWVGTAAEANGGPRRHHRQHGRREERRSDLSSSLRWWKRVVGSLRFQQLQLLIRPLHRPQTRSPSRGKVEEEETPPSGNCGIGAQAWCCGVTTIQHRCVLLSYSPSDGRNQ